MTLTYFTFHFNNTNDNNQNIKQMAIFLIKTFRNQYHHRGTSYLICLNNICLENRYSKSRQWCPFYDTRLGLQEKWCTSGRRTKLVYVTVSMLNILPLGRLVFIWLRFNFLPLSIWCNKPILDNKQNLSN